MYNKDTGLKNSNIRSVLIDDDNKVWLGTTEGVVILNISTGEIVDMSSLSSKYNIEDKLNGCIYKDSHGIYWIGYFLDGGLLKFDPKTQKQNYTG
ncbi:two-component regulator propeller domain-containing protein [Paraclostridium bifermentans]|nr:two-component regulator propeller domain-containing protein [Paraclostridium bifermentans]